MSDENLNEEVIEKETKQEIVVEDFELTMTMNMNHIMKINDIMVANLICNFSGNNIVYQTNVMNNAVLRNRNYKILTKKIFTIELSTYEKDAYFLYYETRNRYYLWEKFKNLDPEYVKIDQKLFKAEKKEMTCSSFIGW